MAQVEKQTGKRPIGLECQEIPDCAEYLWQWFLEINASRSSNGFSINPISYLEIQAWNELTMNWIRPWEIETIKRMDAVFLEFQSENSKKQTSND